MSPSCQSHSRSIRRPSMGRLTLNILLSFAQFQREVIGERIRDKFAASRKKGMWMGGFVPLGYDVKDRKLVVNESEAATVKRIFERFTKGGSITDLVRTLRADRVRGKRGEIVAILRPEVERRYRLIQALTICRRFPASDVADHVEREDRGRHDRHQAYVSDPGSRLAAGL